MSPDERYLSIILQKNCRTEEVRDAEGDHSANGCKVNGAEGERSGDELADDEDGDTRPDAHLRDELVADNAAHDNPNAADPDRHGEQPPAEIVVGEVRPIEQVAVISKAHASCKITVGFRVNNFY